MRRSSPSQDAMRKTLGDTLGSISLRYRPRVAERLQESPRRQRRFRLGRFGGEQVLHGPSIPAQLLRRSRLEAVLFLATEPLSARKLAQLANLTDGTEARTLLEQLRWQYDQRGCAFQVTQVAGGYQLLTHPAFAPWLLPYAPQREEIELSGPAVETLAVVAYRQPVLRAEVEAIRGVGCGEILRQLLERDLLRITGRSQELGRPLLYGTTKRFLEAFGLRNLDQLPRAGQLRRPSSIDVEADEVGASSGLGAERNGPSNLEL